MRKPLKVVSVLLIPLIVVAIGFRIIAHKAAKDYGDIFDQTLAGVSVSGFADTSALREFLSSPVATAPVNQLRSLRFVAGDYLGRIEELQRGVIYLSEQMALDPSQRFSNPPSLRHFSVNYSDSTDDGVAAAVKNLIVSYESQM